MRLEEFNKLPQHVQWALRDAGLIEQCDIVSISRYKTIGVRLKDSSSGLTMVELRKLVATVPFKGVHVENNAMWLVFH